MSKKLMIEYVRSEIEKFGYKCLSEEYINNKTKLELECDKSHQYEVTWANFHTGWRCPYCVGLKKKTTEEIKKYVESFGYKCLSEEYINSKSKLDIQCDKGHQYRVTWDSIQQGKRCSICSGKKKKTIEEIIEYVESFGYKCLSNKYINANVKLELQCDTGHTYKGSWSILQRGKRCPYCAGLKKKTIEEIKGYIRKFRYKCLSDNYKNCMSKLIIKCDKGHIYKSPWSRFQQGHRCPYCTIENKSGENHYNWKNYTEEDRKNFILYRNEVTQLTNINYKKYFYLVNPNNFRRGRNKYHLDHIYSVIDGFNNNVDPDIITSPINLCMLTEYENISKHGISHITLEQLYDLYNQFIEEEKQTCPL